MTGNANIDALWARLEAWGREKAPNMLEDLNPGASDEELGKLQTALGRELPNIPAVKGCLHRKSANLRPDLKRLL